MLYICSTHLVGTVHVHYVVIVVAISLIAVVVTVACHHCYCEYWYCTSSRSSCSSSSSNIGGDCASLALVIVHGLLELVVSPLVVVLVLRVMVFAVVVVFNNC